MKTIPPNLAFTPLTQQNPGTVIAQPGAAPPYAAWFRQADFAQFALLYAGQPDFCVACDLPDGVGNALDLQFPVRPFCDRAWAVVVATGEGSVYLGAYEIPVLSTGGTTIDQAAVYVGDQSVSGMMTVTPSATGVPTMHAITGVYRDTGVTVFALAIFGARSTLTL